jgi:hypothetical protein
VVVGKIGQAASLVALPLLATVRRHGLWVGFPIVLPIVGVTSPPLARAIQAALAIFRIRLDALTVILRTAPPLAVGLTTNGLLWSVRRGLKQLLAVAAAARGRQAQRSFACHCQQQGRVKGCRVWLRVLTASPAGAYQPLLFSTAKSMDFYSGTDTQSDPSC